MSLGKLRMCTSLLWCSLSHSTVAYCEGFRKVACKAQILTQTLEHPVAHAACTQLSSHGTVMMYTAFMHTTCTPWYRDDVVSICSSVSADDSGLLPKLPACHQVRFVLCRLLAVQGTHIGSEDVLRFPKQITKWRGLHSALAIRPRLWVRYAPAGRALSCAHVELVGSCNHAGCIRLCGCTWMLWCFRCSGS
jgi:hypothetical protein